MINSRIFLFITLVLTNIFVYSQNEYALSVESPEGVEYTDNQTIEFSELTYPEASLGFLVRNLTSGVIGVRIEVESMEGTDGSLMELCFGLCYSGITAGTSYPDNNAQPNVDINPGETQATTGDHFFNSDPGNGTSLIEYTFKFYIADEEGNPVVSQAELITEFRLNYVYNSTMSIDDFNQIEGTISHSNGRLKIHSEKQYQLNIYDVRGSLIIEKDIQIGDNYINSLIMPNHMYLLNFIEENGTSIFKKIILN